MSGRPSVARRQATQTMTKARTAVQDIVHKQSPVKTTEVITELFEAGFEAEEAANIVSTECEVIDREDAEYVVGLKAEEVTRAVQIDDLDQKPGEPTGEFYNGRKIVHEDDVDGEPVGLPVLEDTDHPLVPELGHEYYPRELRGNRTDLETVTRALADPDFAVLLIGETGVGKNVLLKKIFAECNWPMQRANFGVGVDYESLVGRFAPRESSESAIEMIEEVRQLAEEEGISESGAIDILTSQQSSFAFVNGILKQCVQNGYAFVGDEINTVTGETTATMHGLTEEGDSRELVVQDTSEVITPDDRFKFIGTMNPVDYAGTNRLNKAFKTRFYPIQVPYLEPEAEKRVILEKSNLSAHGDGEAIAETLVDLADGLRAQMAGGNANDGSLMTAVSSRDLIKIGNMIVDPDGAEFMPPAEATKLIMEGVAAPGDWTAISTTIDSRKFT